MNRLGVVVIGRNEGARLECCLRSVVGAASDVVYVDSGSSDDSVAFAKSLGVMVVQLDMNQPFTAARARNAGFEKLVESNSKLQYVLFVDGDCEMIEGFIDQALALLDSQPTYVLVAGRRIERDPNASVYNRLCDLEWNTPLGEDQACGGESVIRVDAFSEVGMFNPGLIAGEEPELCIRLRKAGGTVFRMDADMSRHDAAITRLRQWWKRAERSGHAYAEGMALHGERPWRHNVKSIRSILIWAFVFPLVMVGCMAGLLVTPWMGLGVIALLGLYPVQWWRIFRYRLTRSDPKRDAAIYAFFTVLGKWPQLLGAGSYWVNRLKGRKRSLIEYK